MHKRIFAFSLLAVVTNAQQQPLEPLTKYRASLFRRALQSFCPFARADPQEDQRWPACLFDAASRFALALEEDCALQPTSTILKHSRASLPDTWLPAVEEQVASAGGASWGYCAPKEKWELQLLK